MQPLHFASKSISKNYILIQQDVYNENMRSYESSVRFGYTYKQYFKNS